MNHSKSFIRLQKHWYKKIKAAGFKDIEYDNPMYLVSQRSNPGKAEYYRIVGLTYWENYKRFNEEDNLIYSLHCNGETMRSIARQIDRSSKYVWQRIQIFEQLMDQYIAKELESTEIDDGTHDA